MQIKPQDRIIVSLDVPRAWQAHQLIEELTPATTFKIGHHLIMDEELLPDVVDYDYWGNNSTAQRRDRTDFFVDFKYLDIPRTDAAAVNGLLRRRNITMCTVHAATSVMTAAVTAARGHDLKILAVALLTSFDDNETWEFFRETDLIKFVERRVQRAVECGCHGVICPPSMVSLMRRQVPDDFLLVVPGIRLAGAAADDHTQPGLPRQVIGDGADYLVVGTSIVDADDPSAVFDQIVEEIATV